MDIQQLIYLDAVDNYKSYTKAADALHVSQPAISIAIRKLENELDIKLFVEGVKPLQLTPIGSRLLRRGRNILLEYENILHEATEYSSQHPTTIKLGLPFTLYNNLLYQLNQEFLPENTTLKLQLFQYGTEVITEKLLQGNLDVGIICSPVISSLQSAPMKSLEFHAFFSQEHKFAQYDVLTPEMLSEETLLLSELESSEVDKSISQYLKKHNVPLNLSHYGMLLPYTASILVEMNQGIAFLEKNFSDQTRNLLHLPLDPPLIISMSVAWNKKKYVTNTQNSLIRFLQEI